VCVWIPLFLLKIENNKKIIFGYCSLMKSLFICLLKKKKKAKNIDVMNTDANPNKHLMKKKNVKRE